MAIIISFMFVFYGFLFLMEAVEAYYGLVWKIFASIFISGGFVFSFGLLVSSWDSPFIR
jgi:hypothetical protein